MYFDKWASIFWKDVSNCIPIPGHAGVRGNETADRLAGRGSGQWLIGPEPFLGVSRQNIRKKMKYWMKNQHLAL